MPADVSQLTAAIAALTDQVAKTETVEASAVTLIQGFAAQITKAVTDALVADNAADDASVAAAQDAITKVTARFTESAGKLGDAVAPPPPAA